MADFKSHPVFEILNHRFGEANLVEFNDVPLIHVPTTRERNFHIVSTIGLSDFDMPVPEKFKDKNRIELFFCLPDYWNPDDIENPNHKWVWDRIAFLSTFPKERNTWFGHGHTIPFNKEETPISEKFQQSYFIMLEPFEMDKIMAPIQGEHGTIHFLAVVPIFKKELDYKVKSGTNKLIRKFIKKGFSEKADMFREVAAKQKWLF